jgi:hypothetical protein
LSRPASSTLDSLDSDVRTAHAHARRVRRRVAALDNAASSSSRDQDIDQAAAQDRSEIALPVRDLRAPTRLSRAIPPPSSRRSLQDQAVPKDDQRGRISAPKSLLVRLRLPSALDPRTPTVKREEHGESGNILSLPTRPLRLSDGSEYLFRKLEGVMIGDLNERPIGEDVCDVDDDNPPALVCPREHATGLYIIAPTRTCPGCAHAILPVDVAQQLAYSLKFKTNQKYGGYRIVRKADPKWKWSVKLRNTRLLLSNEPLNQNHNGVATRVCVRLLLDGFAANIAKQHARMPAHWKTYNSINWDSLSAEQRQHYERRLRNFQDGLQPSPDDRQDDDEDDRADNQNRGVKAEDQEYDGTRLIDQGYVVKAKDEGRDGDDDEGMEFGHQSAEDGVEEEEDAEGDRDEHVEEDGDALVNRLPPHWQIDHTEAANSQLRRIKPAQNEVLLHTSLNNSQRLLTKWHRISLLPLPLNLAINLSAVIQEEDAVAARLAYNEHGVLALAEMMTRQHHIRIARDMTPLEVAFGLRPAFGPDMIQLAIYTDPLQLPGIARGLQEDYQVNAQAIRNSTTLTEVGMGQQLERLWPALLMLASEDQYEPGSGEILSSPAIEAGAAVLREYQVVSRSGGAIRLVWLIPQANAKNREAHS